MIGISVKCVGIRVNGQLLLIYGHRPCGDIQQRSILSSGHDCPICEIQDLLGDSPTQLKKDLLGASFKGVRLQQASGRSEFSLQRTLLIDSNGK